jgi:hypothetical protein
MRFNDVWGFDPDEAPGEQARFRGEDDADSSSYNVNHERAARIPRDAWSQVCELWRLFRL